MFSVKFSLLCAQNFFFWMVQLCWISFGLCVSSLVNCLLLLCVCFLRSTFSRFRVGSVLSISMEDLCVENVGAWGRSSSRYSHVHELLPIANDTNRTRGNIAEKARLDVSGVGVWGNYEKTFLDIRVMHPNSPSYINKSLDQVYALHEKEKKKNYLERVIQIEKGSFTPIVFSTFGGTGTEADRHHKRIATLIATKKNENYADVINFIRTRLRFSLLRSILTAVRGVRGKKRPAAPISSVEFNLIERSDE